MPAQIDLYSYYEGEVDALTRFKKYWAQRHERDPEHFPRMLTPGEWDEQFRAWAEC